jgi:hypothetical protein
VFVRFGLDFDALDHIENFIPSDPENESTGRFGEIRSRFYDKAVLRDQEPIWRGRSVISRRGLLVFDHDLLSYVVSKFIGLRGRINP